MMTTKAITNYSSKKSRQIRPGPKPSYSIRFPPSDKKIVYREASTAARGTTAATSTNIPPAYLRTLSRLQQGITSPRAITQTQDFTSSSSGNMRNASYSVSPTPPASIDYLYKSYPILPISSYASPPANEVIDPRTEQIRSRVREASSKLGIPQPKPAWLKGHNYFLSGEYR